VLKQRARLFGRGLLLSELIAWTLAFVAAHAVRDGWGDGLLPIGQYLPVLYASLVLWVGHSAGYGLLRSHRTRPVLDEAWGVLVGTVVVFVGVSVLVFATQAHTSRALVVLDGAFGCLGVAAICLVVRLALRRARVRGFNFRTLAIVGDGPLPAQIAEVVREHREWGIQVAGFVPVTRDPGVAPPEPVLGYLDEIAHIVDDNVIDEVIFAVDRLRLEQLEHAFACCEEAGVNTRIVLNFFPHKFSRLELDELDGFPMLAFHATSNAELELLVKRVVDVAIAGAALAVGAPVFLLVALAVRLSGPGPVVFVQRRVGLNGREFEMFKFRSMVPDAEARREGLLDRNEMSGPVFKIRDDPRVTAVGRFLRRTSLDEIPQFWNVLRGEMSLVGPRPPLPSEVVRYERWQRRRLSVKPGVTGMWQVSGRNEVDFDAWMRLDLSYIDQWSLWLDLKIFVLTIPAVLFRRGSS
jgi:exopolysaccharide biosynthesis polyprenyl glycosylphosphotransferase